MVFHHRRPTLLVCAFACASLACDADEPSPPAGDDLEAADADDGELGKADGAEDSFTYFEIEQDYRKCISPLCGGYWVSRVNRHYTRCSDGWWRSRCYVADLDFGFSGLSEPQAEAISAEVTSNKVLLRGEIGSSTWGDFGELGRLVITEAWMGASDEDPEGLFVRVTDSGLVCITTPCYGTLHEDKLNSILDTDTSELDLSSWNDLSDEEVAGGHEQVFGDDGLIVAGYRYYFYDGGWQRGRVAAQFYERMIPEDPQGDCVRGGCSSQLCVDSSQGDIGSTCEWLPHYACLQQAPCERQPDGECGHTPSPELDACFDAADG